MTLAEQVSLASQYYQNKFPEIDRMSWEELSKLKDQDNRIETNSASQKAQNAKNANEKGVVHLALIDVRTKEERDVSTIPGSIALDTFHNEIVNQLSPQANVVTFCTIGYRSGMEARHLKALYPDLKVSHLEGIVSYIHSNPSQYTAGMAKDGNGLSDTVSERKATKPLLINLSSNNLTNKIHTFSKQWDYTEKKSDDSNAKEILESEDFEPVYFSFADFCINVIKVGIRSVRYEISSFFS